MIKRSSGYGRALDTIHLTLRQLQIFVAVAETGSTVAAGQRVALSQSATSSAIHELERVLATPLFDRVGKRLALNDHGRTLLPRAQSLLNSASDIERSGMDVDARIHDLRIGASTTLGNYVLPKLIGQLHKSKPRQNSTWQSQIIIGNTADICDRVSRFELDIGFIEGPTHRADLAVHTWLRDEMILLCAQSHRRGRTLADLRDAIWLLREEGSGTREVTDQALLPHLVSYRRSIVLGSSEAIKHAAAQGLGVACLSRWVVEDHLRDRRLQVIGSPLTPIYRQCHWVIHRDRMLTPAIEQLVALAGRRQKIRTFGRELS